jgi:hypothetical protein
MTTATENKIDFEKATIYTTGELMGNVQKVEVRRGDVEVKPYAQFSDAVHVKYVPKGARRQRGFVKSFKPFVLILEGHGHPDPDSLFGEAVPSSVEGVSVAHGRHSAFGDEWTNDFRGMMGRYIAKSQGEAKVIFSRDEK